MFQHNLLIIFRSFKRFKSTSIINLIVLSTGLPQRCSFIYGSMMNFQLISFTTRTTDFTR